MGVASNKDALKNRNITHIRPCSLKHSSKQCCEACKAMCTGNDGPCLCDTWVFCGNKKSCGSRFGECWLKKQKDILAPDRQEAGQNVMWTSGLIFGKGQPVASRESFVPGNEKIRTNGSTNHCDEVDDIICSRSTQDKRLRKTSTVKEPILQHVKRQKSLAICV